MRRASIPSRLMLLLALWFAMGCQSLGNILNTEHPDVRADGLTVTAVTDDAADLTVDLTVTNPYDVSVSLTRLTYTLSTGSKTFLSAAVPLTGSLPSGDTMMLHVPGRLMFAELLKVHPGFKPGDVVPYHAELDLLLNAPAVGPMHVYAKGSGQLLTSRP